VAWCDNGKSIKSREEQSKLGFVITVSLDDRDPLYSLKFGWNADASNFLHTGRVASHKRRESRLTDVAASTDDDDLRLAEGGLFEAHWLMCCC
jgi:hypothetical protein